MALGSCLTCIKYLMFFFNFVFWLVGCVILSLGIWVLVDKKSFQSIDLDPEASSYLEAAPYLMIAVGSLILFIGFLGCCGSIKESQCMLATFFVFLFIIFAVLVAFGIYIAINRKEVTSKFSSYTYDKYQKAAQHYTDNEQNQQIVHSFQLAFKCCGYNSGSRDFPTRNVTGCSSDSKQQICTPTYVKETLDRSIENTESDKQKAIIFAGVCLGIGAVLVLGMIFSMMLCCAIRDSM